MSPEQLMQLAIDKCKEGLSKGQSPFGCAIAINDQVLSVTHNTVAASTDITAHAEINALRKACQTHDTVLLTGAIVASTCEPCPMCMAALHWARVEKVYYGATIEDAKQAGFNELTLNASQLIKLGQSPVLLQADVLRDECRKLFTTWLENPNRIEY